MINTPRSGPATELTPSETTFSASMSSPESVSSRTANFGCWRISWRISIRFFSPPENPSLRHRGDHLHRGLDVLGEVTQRDRLLASGIAVGVDHRPQVLGDGHARDRNRVLK